MKDLSVMLLMLALAAVAPCCQGGGYAGTSASHATEKRDAEQKTPPFGVMSTCICYPMSEGLPAGFPGKNADPALLAEWVKNQGSVSSYMENVAESRASADVSAPTYVQVYKDDSVDTTTVA